MRSAAAHFREERLQHARPSAHAARIVRVRQADQLRLRAQHRGEAGGVRLIALLEAQPGGADGHACSLQRRAHRSETWCHEQSLAAIAAGGRSQEVKAQHRAGHRHHAFRIDAAFHADYLAQRGQPRAGAIVKRQVVEASATARKFGKLPEAQTAHRAFCEIVVGVARHDSGCSRQRRSTKIPRATQGRSV